MHSGVALARAPETSNHKVYEDAEWQADTFAAEFLMPTPHVCHCCSPEEILETFGVSYSAASTRWEKLREQGVLK
jgi:Zn-dependent peptidase ImmA (M78 family)